MNISIKDLTKIYANDKRALDSVDLEIGNGLFGLLGPNGAGKTTLMRILVTLMKPTRGSVHIDQLDLDMNRAEIRKMIGYLPQDFSTFPKVKTWEFLEYNARLADIRSRKRRMELVDQHLDRVGLFEARDRLAGKLSGGMKRRLGIAQALIGDPKILVVDEPTTGLDPEERIRFRNLLTEMGQEERVIILSTHIVGDISSTCHDMALLVDGKVGFKGEPGELIRMARGHVFEIDVTDMELNRVREQYTVISTIPAAAGWKVQIVAESMAEFSGAEIEPNLEHAYVHFIDQRYRDLAIDNIGSLEFSDD